jgi:molecular chaperone DnaK (HSP70)
MYTILVSMEKKKRDALVVVGIDFGTTYSGYGYSFRDEYKKDHSKIYCNTDWKSGDGLVTTKTPTVILFDENGKFQSFGCQFCWWRNPEDPEKTSDLLQVTDKL